MLRLVMRAVAASAALVAFSGVPATAFLVSNLNDSGGGSLRQAVLDANGNAGADVITFQPGLSGTIHLTSGEIAITDSVDIQGPGARTLAVDSTARIFNISGGDTVNVMISGLTLTGAHANGNGGAITNGTPANHNGVNLTLSFDNISGNNTTQEGGAIYHNPSANPGGGVLTIENSTISGNKANKAGAIYSIGYDLEIIDSTISGNTATDSVGGIKLEFGFASIYNSTIFGNKATFSQGGILAGTGNVQLNLTSTIVAGNTDGAGANDLQRFSGTVNAANSLFQQSLAVGVINGTNTSNLVGVDPLLAPLANYGGPTDTNALTHNSPAINAGSNPLSLTYDQRGAGFLRVIGPAADIGAYEFVARTDAPVASAFGIAGLGLALLLLGAVLLRRRPQPL